MGKAWQLMEPVSSGASPREFIAGSPRVFPREFTDGQCRGTAGTAKALNFCLFFFSFLLFSLAVTEKEVQQW